MFLESVQNNVDVVMSYIYLSKIYSITGDLNKAIEYAKLAVKEEPYDTSYKQHLDKLIKFSNEKNII